MAGKQDDLLPTQIKILIGNAKTLAMGHFLIALAVLYMYWGVVETKQLAWWSGGIIISILYRLTVHFFYRRNRTRTAQFWRKFYLLGSVLSGSMWGCIGIFNLPVDIYYLTLVTLCVLGAATIGSSNVYMPAFLLFFLPLMLPTTVRIWLDPIDTMQFLPMVSIVYYSITILLAWQQNKAAVQSIKLRFENIHFVEQLTDQKDRLQKNEVELIEARNKAEQANLAKSRFLAAASHDLRQPLHALGLFIGALDFKMKEHERNDLHEKLKVTHKSLAELFDALLDLSRMDANAVDVHIQPTQIKTLLNRILTEFEELAKVNNIELRLHAGDFIVETDPILLELVVRNLISNALRYTNKGGVLVGVRERGNDVVIQVWDTGVGIQGNDLVIIFDEFKQLDNPSRKKSEGLGLGLSIVRRLCSLLDHEISVKSCVDKGSVFSLTLPKSSTPLYTYNARFDSLEDQPLNGINVLIIDDEESVRNAMTLVVKRWGCHVRAVESLQSAIRIMDSGELIPDVVVSDYQISDEENGLDVLAYIRRRYGGAINMLVITGDTTPDIVQTFKLAGVRVLNKPVQMAKLRMVLAHLSRKHIRDVAVYS